MYYLYNQGLGSIFITIYAFGIRRREFPQFTKETSTKMLLLGFLLSLALVATTFGLNLSTSVNYGFLVKGGVIFGPLLALLFLSEKLSHIKLILIPTFLVGAYFISTQGQTLIPHTGDILIIISAFFFSITDVLMKKLTGHWHHDIVASFRGLLTSAFLFLFVVVFVRNFSTNVPMIYLIVSGLLVASGQIMLLKTISLSSVSYLSLMTMITPIIVTAIGFFVLREPFTMMHVLGGVIILISGYLVQKHNI